MDFKNETILSARLFTGLTGPTEGLASIVARSTYRLPDDSDKDGGDVALRPSEEPWPIFDEALKTDAGVFPTDMTPAHTGCDLVLTGIARSNKPVRSLTVTASVGSFTRQLLVLGDRTWQARRDDLRASEPEPFTEMPLDWSRAFGGAAEYEGQAVPFVLNAEGKGFYLTREQALNRPLPNLEQPANPIRTWQDRPLPACFAPVKDPLTWHLAKASLEINQAGEGEVADEILARIHERCVLSACQPDLIMPGAAEGDPVVITGFGGRGLRFSIPGVAPRVKAEVGPEEHEADLAIAGLWILLSQRLVVITYRGGFRYTFNPREQRRAVLLPGERGGPTASTETAPRNA